MFQFPPFNSYQVVDWSNATAADTRDREISLTRCFSENQQETHLVLVHIPIELYSFCLQPILRLLFGEEDRDLDDNDDVDVDVDASKIPWTNRHDFLNLSITPIECSIICSRSRAEKIIRPVAEALNAVYANANANANANGSGGWRKAKSPAGIEISEDDYIVIQVDGQGLDAGQRVLELTSPLAMAGISIFFITTYFSDYILVPFRSRRTVTKALQQRGFVFSQSADAFVSQLSPSSPTPTTTTQAGRITSPFYEASAPSTPPAKDIPELQIRTFTKLMRNNVKPIVDERLLLISCAGSREFDREREESLRSDLLQVLLSTLSLPRSSSTKQASRHDSSLGFESLKIADGKPPDFAAKFLSLTLTTTEPISVFLEHRLLSRLGGSLLGAKSEEDALVPITLDLRDLPMEATGIVCGVAGRLAQAGTEVDEIDWSPSPQSAKTDGNAGGGIVDISFLSTARAGTVVVKASQLELAVEALEYGMRRVADLV
ncbi:uncharacterized protein A1O9_09254 [Exophiala aquamarina CBS 119918]|uniref:CASTOR ACT domain-containing protein n=1 Tax=Exophiala aquamarina CBS 119918 TaxID=1182545 RepID=A0A072P542_9EURO|nr:uncharacterized protein A1O9_09254 [Exophiala aquamarina CBS 119918]KEF54812.1 hypothetical protein A1O9_09254 [Exophiala aquamarina CBS 119918]